MHLPFELAELASRDEPSLTHNKVGQLELARDDAALHAARHSPLAIAASHNVVCIVDGDGESVATWCFVSQPAPSRDQSRHRVSCQDIGSCTVAVAKQSLDALSEVLQCCAGVVAVCTVSHLVLLCRCARMSKSSPGACDNRETTQGEWQVTYNMTRQHVTHAMVVAEEHVP